MAKPMKIRIQDPAGDVWVLAGGTWWRTPPREDRAWNAVPGGFAPPQVILGPGESVEIGLQGVDAILYGHGLTRSATPPGEAEHG